MAGNTAILAVKIIGDAKSGITAIEATELALSDLGDTGKKSGTKMAGAWTAAAAAALACSKAAGALEQSTGAVSIIFEDSAPKVMEWAEGMAVYGLSTAQAAQGAAVLGAQLQNLGIAQETSAVLSAGLIQLSADLAAVMGGSTADAAAALGAAMRGEYDSLEKYGIALTADAVAAEVLRLQQEGVTFSSESQAKAVATLSLIWGASTQMQGAAEEQSATLNSAMGHLRASVTNLAAAIGGPLNSVLGPLIDLIARTIDQVTTFINESEVLNAVLDILAGILETIADICETVLAPIIDHITDVFERFGDLLDRTVIPILERLEETFDKIAQALDKVIGLVQDAITWFQNLTSAIGDAIDKLTFWNNEAENVTVPEGMLAPIPPATMLTTAAAGARTAAPTVNVYMGLVTDPHATARAIRRLLASQNVEQGRPAGAMEPRRAW